MYHLSETIAAIATPLGRGGIGIIRISGTNALSIAQRITGKKFTPRYATYCDFKDLTGEKIDQGIVLYFKEPHSFTGENVIELQGHGGPVLMNSLLQSVLKLGARLAQPGEFSERAFLNNRLDLVQAEAIADLIQAGSEEAARAAVRSLQGEFSKKVSTIDEKLIQFRTMIEASIDFSDEDIDVFSDHEVTEQLGAMMTDIHQLCLVATQGKILQEGMSLVIAGLPNAGKSKLLNALSEKEVAIVTAIAGTTRDVLQVPIHLDGLPIHLVDTAGLHMTDNPIEQEGIQRALKEIKNADQILWIVDSTLSETSITPLDQIKYFLQEKLEVPVAIVRNKTDLSHEPVGIEHGKLCDIIRLSAETKEGLDILKDYLKAQMGYSQTAIGFSARTRHIDALTRATCVLETAKKEWQVAKTIEILAHHLNEAHQILGEIVGIFTTDALLGNIFSQFCIGK